MGKNDGVTTEIEKEKGENYVKEGTIIALAGNTGKYTTGAHLHFELRKYEKVGDRWINPNENNGYWGAINPLPYFMDYCIFSYGDVIKDYYYKGKLITKEEAYTIKENL